jgi:dCMP deaminase
MIEIDGFAFAGISAIAGRGVQTPYTLDATSTSRAKEFSINRRSSREIQLDQTYMEVAKLFAKLSRAERLKVGAVLVRDRQILAEGYNGTPTGMSNVMEIDDITVPEVIHAEMNILCKIAKSAQTSVGSTLYVTHSPCFTCAKLLYQAGIVRVVYDELYRDTDPLEFLKSAGVIVECISDL